MRVRVHSKALLGILLFFLSHQASSQTNIQEGSVSGKWVKQKSTYFIDSEIKIPHCKKLIIEPEVKIFFTREFHATK